MANQANDQGATGVRGLNMDFRQRVVINTAE